MPPLRFLPCSATALLLASLSFPTFAASTLQMRVPIGDGVTPPAYAAASSIPGLNYASSWYRALQGAFSYGNGSYLTTSGNLQAQMTLPASAGATALANMQANPTGVAGTQAATWLAGQGLSYSGGQWMKTPADTAPQPGMYWYVSYSPAGSCWGTTTGLCSWSSMVAATIAGYQASNPNTSNFSTGTNCVGPGSCILYLYFKQNGNYYSTSMNTIGYGSYTPAPVPATPSDWAALPDPTPAVGAELPYAPYMPQGAPVGTTTITDLNSGKTYTCTNGACG